MNTMNILYASLFSLTVVAPFACEDIQTDALDKPHTLALSPAEEEKVRRDNIFSLKLFSDAVDKNQPSDNLLLSPISASIALSMLNNGAVGETNAAIAKGLQSGDLNPDQVNNYYQKIIKALPNIDPDTELNIANSIWYRQEFRVLPDFLTTNQKFYQAEIGALNFRSADAPAQINNWVDRSTKGKIPTIVEEIPGDMMMYLINAIYFKGTWQDQFDVSKTSTMPFHKSGGQTVQADFMNIERSFNRANTSSFQGIELPYSNGQFSMIVLLPAKGTDTREFVKSLNTIDQFENMYSKFSKATTNLFLPKFKFSYQNKLNDELSRLGMGIIFTDQANFTGIAKEDLMVDEVKQKAFIEVNEEGTEAAAVTSVGVRVTSMPIVETMKLDRPFVFLIRENNCGLILFTGLINDPLQESSGD